MSSEDLIGIVVILFIIIIIVLPIIPKENCVQLFGYKLACTTEHLSIAQLIIDILKENLR